MATPITEVGRDHDYDWAIIEPSSTRSVLQCSGRVQRHREQAVNQPNIGILSRNFHGTLNKPGFEPRNPTSSWIEARAVDKSLISLIEDLSPKTLLRASTTGLPALERRAIAESLTTSINATLVDRKNSLLTNYHPTNYRFRQKTVEFAEIYYCPIRRKFFIVNKEANAEKDGTPNQIELRKMPILAGVYDLTEIEQRWCEFAGESYDNLNKARRFFTTEVAINPKIDWIASPILGTYPKFDFTLENQK